MSKTVHMRWPAQGLPAVALLLGLALCLGCSGADEGPDPDAADAGIAITACRTLPDRSPRWSAPG